MLYSAGMSKLTGLHGPSHSAYLCSQGTASPCRVACATQRSKGGCQQRCHQIHRPVRRLQATSTKQESDETESLPAIDSEPVSRPSTSSQQQVRKCP